MSKNKIKHKNLFADFETTFFDKKKYEAYCLDYDLDIDQEKEILIKKSSKMFLAGVCDEEGKYLQSYEYIPHFFDNCVKLANKRQKVHVYFHNLKFDGSYILNWLLKNRYKETLKKNKWGNPILNEFSFSSLISNGKWFLLVMKWKGKILQFEDSLKKLPASLSDLSKSFLSHDEVGKMEVDKNIYKEFKLLPLHNYPQLWLDYLQQDVLALKNILKKYFYQDKNAETKMTIGAFAYSKIKKLVEDSNSHLTKNEYNYYKNFYRGGLCLVKRQIQGDYVFKPKKIKMVDACSMYPSQMIKFLPVGKPILNPEVDKMKKYAKFHEVKIYKADIREEYAGIAILHVPLKTTDGIHFKKPKMYKNIEYLEHYVLDEKQPDIFYLSDVDLSTIKKLYKLKYEIIKTTYFKKEKFLKEKVEELFIAKKEAAKNGDKSKKQVAKLVLNNLYGKLGQHYYKTQSFYSKELDSDEYMIVNEKTKLSCVNESVAYNVTRRIDLVNDKCQPVNIAGYITSLARENLVNKIIEIIKNKNDFLYCDTDSVIYVEKNKQDFNDIGDELGCWEYEKYKYEKEEYSSNVKPADVFISLAPKQYRIHYNLEGSKPVKFACAGCSRNDIYNLPLKDYNYDINLNKNTLVNSFHGFVIEEIPFNFEKYKSIGNPKYKKGMII